VNGTFVNWTTPTSNVSAGSLVTTVSTNIPWFFTFALIIFYIVLFIYLQDEPGRKKYLYITFVGMIASVIMGLYNLVPTATILGSVGLFIITMLFVLATSD
jgi:hypothetical protein